MTSGGTTEGRTSLHQNAYDRIKSAILTGEFQPNQRLIESELAQWLGLSRSPLREALRLLEQQAIVEHTARKGWRVCPIRLEDIRNIFEIKLLLEPYAVARAAERASGEERSEILRIVDRMAEAQRDGDTEAWIEHDWAFHELVFNCTRNRQLKQTLFALNDQWMRVRIGILGMTRRMEKSLQEHREIAESFFAGDADTASRMTRDHLVEVLKSVEELLRGLLALKINGV